MKKLQSISFASGCLMLISRKCLDTIGVLDDSFFLYSEDTDYCCRILDGGFNIVYNPFGVIYHKISSSTVSNSDFQNYYLVRNNLVMVKRYCSNKRKAYRLRLIRCIKEILKKRMSVKVMRWAYYDFKHGVDGKGLRFAK